MKFSCSIFFCFWIVCQLQASQFSWESTDKNSRFRIGLNYAYATRYTLPNLDPDWAAFLQEKDELKKNYPCMPIKNREGDFIQERVREEMYFVFFFIQRHKDEIKTAFDIEQDSTVFYLFRLAIGGMDREGLWLPLSQMKNRRDTRWVMYWHWWGGLKIIKWLSGKEPSVGPYNMRPSIFYEMKATRKLRKWTEVNVLWTDRVTSTLAVMELHWILYNKSKNALGINGPSVSIKGDTIPKLTGDIHWDISVSAYVFSENHFLCTYCRTKNKEGEWNYDYAAPCHLIRFLPYKSPEEASAKGRPWTDTLIVQRNHPIPNYLIEVPWIKKGKSNFNFVRDAQRRQLKAYCFQ
jgi:hypothetical protein